MMRNIFSRLIVDKSINIDEILSTLELKSIIIMIIIGNRKNLMYVHGYLFT